MSSSDELVNYCISTASGRIVRYGYCNRGGVSSQAINPGEEAHEGFGTDTGHWWNGTAIVPKAALPAFDRYTLPADGDTVATAAGLPNPTRVTISGATQDEFSVTDGALALSFDTPGTYRVSLDAGPAYLRTEVTIDAT